MQIERIVTGIYAANCYIVHGGQLNEAIVVDPGGNVEDIARYLRKRKLNLKKIVLTHGHLDHIGGAEELRRITEAKIVIHKKDAYMLHDAEKNMSATAGGNAISFIEDDLLRDGDIIAVDGINALVIHTPGHSAGGICLKIEDTLFSGDTLFRGSIGRTDLDKGSMGAIMSSIMDKLMKLPDETRVFPGHGSETSIGYERENNPFILQMRNQ
ncbi:MAG: MBL fold metallo-hydrolase [Peptostreptococcaceae bacterium]|nr:MBL fold metallo-hydrolase [Peptostreptococcaceae bacterium]